MYKLKEINKVLDMYSLPKHNQEEIHNMTRPITSTEIESVIKKNSQQQKSSTRWLILPNI